MLQPKCNNKNKTMIMSFEIFLINLVFSVEVEKMSPGQMSPRQTLTGHMPL